MEDAATLMGGVFFITWLLLMVGMVVGWIVFLVALWRGMKAHESIAETLKDISQGMKNVSSLQS